MVTTLMDKQKLARLPALVCKDLQLGMIYIDTLGVIRFLNEKAAEVIGLASEELMNHKMIDVLPECKLTDVLQTRRSYSCHRFTLNHTNEIIGNYYPLINEKQHLEGAYMLFHKRNSIERLGKNVTNANDIERMLELILRHSNDMITVVDASGKYKMLSDHLARQLQVDKASLIGKQATIDMFQGNKVHLEVLKHRRAITKRREYIGQTVYEIYATPYIVAGKLKGSIAIYQDITNKMKLKDKMMMIQDVVRNLERTFTFNDMIFQSDAMIAVEEQAKYAASSTIPVLLTGNQGTEKSVLANAIHHESSRKYNKFIHFHATDLEVNRMDQLMAGNGGTIFIEGLESVSTDIQKAFVDMIQHKSITIDHVSHPVNIRFIIGLQKPVSNVFVANLLDALQLIEITLAPLSKRAADFDGIIGRNLTIMNHLHKTKVLRVSDEARDLLLQHPWQGDVKELEAVLYLAFTLVKPTDTEIDIAHLPSLLYVNLNDKTPKKVVSLQKKMDEYERSYIKDIYVQYHFNKTETAKVLGISVRNLYYKIEKFNLDET